MFARNHVLAAAGLALALGTGCSGTTDFDISKTLDPVDSPGIAGGAATQHVDLAADAGSAWKHRRKVKSLDLTGIDATLTANHTGVATTSTGAIVVSRAGTNVTLGKWTDEPIPATPPHSIGVVLQPEGVSVINDALRSDGQFDVTLAGSTAVPLSFGVEVTLHLKLKYKVP